jgi:hypothetical protein
MFGIVLGLGCVAVRAVAVLVWPYVTARLTHCDRAVDLDVPV